MRGCPEIANSEGPSTRSRESNAATLVLLHSVQSVTRVFPTRRTTARNSNPIVMIFIAKSQQYC